MTGEEAGQQVV